MAILFFGGGPGGTIALPGYSVFILPWAAHKSNVGTVSRFQNSGMLGGGQTAVTGSGASNSIGWDIYLEAGTYKFALLHGKEPDVGIYSPQFSGVSQGLIDGYAAAQALNTYSEITGIVVTAGLKTFTLGCPTKNASASDYSLRFHALAWIRTGS